MQRSARRRDIFKESRFLVVASDDRRAWEGSGGVSNTVGGLNWPPKGLVGGLGSGRSRPARGSQEGHGVVRAPKEAREAPPIKGEVWGSELCVGFPRHPKGPRSHE